MLNEENKLLKNTNFKIPENLYSTLLIRWGKVKDNPDYTENDGYKRLQNIVDSNGVIGYKWMCRIKNFWDYYNGDENDMTGWLNGGLEMKKWVNDELARATQSVEMGKNTVTKAGGKGYKSTHYRGEGTKMNSINLLTEDIDDDLYDFNEALVDAPMSVLTDFEPQKKQKWYLIDPQQYATALKEYMHYGFLNRFPEEIIKGWGKGVLYNIIQLYGNTILAGHTDYIPLEEINDFLGTDFDSWGGLNKYLDKMGLYDTMILPDGSDAWSDYAFQEYFNYVEELIKEKDFCKKLIIIDGIIDVSHQRGNLASMFIKGGTPALKKIRGESMGKQKTYIITDKQLGVLYEHYLKEQEVKKFPQHLLKAIAMNKTSIGSHPALPPEQEREFIHKVLVKRYEKILGNMNLVDDATDLNDIDGLKTLLSKLVTETVKLEKPVKEQLEGVVMDIITDTFGITSKDVNLKLTMVDKISEDDIKLPLQPEDMDDVEFESIDDIVGINEEVYKRRMVNCLIQGIASQYLYTPENYVNKIYKINPQLLILYSKIIPLNDYITFVSDGNTYKQHQVTQGSASEVLIKSYDRSDVEVKGINFIALLHEAFKAMFDLISFNALPKGNVNNVKYILKKSDFALATPWDTKLGYPLWSLISNKIPEEINAQLLTPYLFYELVTKPVKEFNTTLQNIFANTGSGTKNVVAMCKLIKNNLEREKFYKDFEKKKKNDKDYFDDNEF
jgi:hypothetical protein